MDRVHEGVHGPGPQGWSMDLGSMFCIRPGNVGCKVEQRMKLGPVVHDLLKMCKGVF